MTAAMLPVLYEEEVDADLPFDPEQGLPVPVPAEGQQAADVSPEAALPVQDYELRQVRAMLVRLRQAEADAARVAATRKEVLAAYQRREEQLAVAALALRGALQAVLERGPYGTKLDFPDAGKLHLSTTGGNLVLDSQEAAVSEYGFRFEKSVVDHALMNAWARDHYKATGEVPTGYKVEPQRRTLVVKKP